MTIHFPDLSHFEAGVSLAGVPALLTKATQGTSYTDPTYATYKAAAHAAGIPFGGYHYVTLDDPQAQAEHAYSVLGTTPAMWDVEKASGTFAHLLAVDSAFTALGGRALFAYIPHWYWEQIGRPDLTPLLARGLALISSQYTTYSDTGPGWAPYGGVTPMIWQYTNAGLCNGRHVDMNAFRGSATELARLFNPSNPGDGVIDMTTVDLTPAAVAAIWAYKQPGGINESLGGALSDLRTAAQGGSPTAILNAIAVVSAKVDTLLGDETTAAMMLAAAKAELDAMKVELDGVPAAVAASLPPLAGGQPGFSDDQLAQIKAAVADVLGRTTATLTVAPSAPSAG